MNQSHQILNMPNSHHLTKTLTFNPQHLSSSRPYLSFSFINYLYLLALFLCLLLLKLLYSDSCSHHYNKIALLKVTKNLHVTQWLACDTSYHSHHPKTFPSHDFCDTTVPWFSPTSLITNPSQTSFEDTTFPTRPFNCGVSKASLLSPFLFPPYYFSLCELIHTHGFKYHPHSFDDHTSLLSSRFCNSQLSLRSLLG